MIRWIAVLLALLALSGCVTTREVVYRDGYYGDRYADTRVYRDDGYDGGRYYERDGSYYSPSYSGRGDYYYGTPDYYASGYPSWYVDYPAYYSLFWGFNRTWYDPYWYPNYYYGVTYYPRNYFSISFGSPYRGHLYYSPYRYSWVDNYYDWSPWHHHSHHRNRHSSPRYGSARNEAERLARISGHAGYGARRDGAPGGRGSASGGGSVFDRYGSTRDGRRDADYGGRADPRQASGGVGTGLPGDDGARSRDRGYGAYGRGDSGSRALPRNGFANGDARDNATPAAGYGREARGDAQHEIGRIGNRGAVRRTYPQYEAAAPRRDPDGGVTMPRDAGRSESGYERGYGRGGYSRPADAPTAREYSRPALTTRGHDAAPQADGGYRMPARERYSAPAQESRSYAPAPETRSYSAPSRGYDAGRSAPAPHYSEPAPRYESRSESRSESRRDDSSSDDGGGRGMRSKHDE